MRDLAKEFPDALMVDASRCGHSSTGWAYEQAAGMI
jgi:hypothetical protein